MNFRLARGGRAVAKRLEGRGFGKKTDLREDWDFAQDVRCY
jgi:hypothetical protein